MKKAILHLLKCEDKPKKAVKPRRALWWCNHRGDVSDVVVVGGENGKPLVVAHTLNTSEASASYYAELIVSSVNNQEQMREIIKEMIDALELCLDSGGLTWNAEQEAEFVSSKARQII